MLLVYVLFFLSQNTLCIVPCPSDWTMYGHISERSYIFYKDIYTVCFNRLMTHSNFIGTKLMSKDRVQWGHDQFKYTDANLGISFSLIIY